MNIIVLCHLHYHHLWEDIKGYLNKLNVQELYFNLTDQSIVGEIQNDFPNCKILISPNQGKDCGGNLRLINEWIKNGANGDLIFQCHSKLDNYDRAELFGDILNKHGFFENQEVGMIGSAKHWACEYANGSTIEHRKYCRRFGFSEVKPMTYIRGTMFFVKAKIYRDFFSKLDIVSLADELEYGNVQEPSNTHAWERLFATIVEEQGYKVVPA